MQLAGRLGADVPFFILDTPFAIGRSRGDRLKPIRSSKRFWHLLVYPGFELPTKEVYEEFDAKHLPKGLTRRRDGVKIRLPNFEAVESMLYNDLEVTARSKKDIIDYIIKRLALRLGKKAILSGSGPSLFCLYRTGKEAVRGRDLLFNSVAPRERKSWRGFIVKTEA